MSRQQRPAAQQPDFSFISENDTTNLPQVSTVETSEKQPVSEPLTVNVAAVHLDVVAERPPPPPFVPHQVPSQVSISSELGEEEEGGSPMEPPYARHTAQPEHPMPHAAIDSRLARLIEGKLQTGGSNNGGLSNRRRSADDATQTSELGTKLRSLIRKKMQEGKTGYNTPIAESPFSFSPDITVHAENDFTRVSAKIETTLPADQSHGIVETLTVAPDRKLSRSHVATICNRLTVSQHVNHPNVAKYVAYHAVPHAVRALVDFDATQTLATFIRTSPVSPLPIAVVRALTHQIVAGLAALHAGGVAHRDLTTTSILVHRDGTRVALIGAHGEEESKWGAEAVYDSERFQSVAPEQLSESPFNRQKGSPKLFKRDAAVDIWAAGCVVLRLLGREPWAAHSPENGGQQRPPSATNLSWMSRMSENTLPTGVPHKKCPASLFHFFERCFDRNAATRATAVELLEMAWLVCSDAELEEPL